MAWLLTNQRGYTDGVQIRMVDGSGVEVSPQAEAGASSLDVRQVTQAMTFESKPVAVAVQPGASPLHQHRRSFACSDQE
jgi:hypothetical protein